MKVTEENKEELLNHYVNDIYASISSMLPKYRPSMETIARYSHEDLVSFYALTVEYIIRLKRECGILKRILNDSSFKPFELKKFEENFEKLRSKAEERKHQEYLREKEWRKKLLGGRRRAAENRKNKTSN